MTSPAPEGCDCCAWCGRLPSHYCQCPPRSVTTGGGCARASDCDYPACWIDGGCTHLAWTGDDLPTTWRDQ